MSDYRSIGGVFCSLTASTDTCPFSRSSLSFVSSSVLRVLAALVVPVLWGLAVHGIFSWLNRRTKTKQIEEPVLPDYQI